MLLDVSITLMFGFRDVNLFFLLIGVLRSHFDVSIKNFIIGFEDSNILKYKV